MQDIDFLPVQYRQEHFRRQSQPWRLVVAVVFALLLAAAAFSQHLRRQRVEEELAALTPQYQSVVDQSSRLAEIQSQLQAARNTAELLTYLRHPWPPTQLLAALLGPLPEEITFEQVDIVGQTPPDRAPDRRRGRPATKTESGEGQTLPAAVRDLQRLRDQCDAVRTVVLISGTAREGAALHAYLGKLGDTDIFSKAELGEIETAEDEQLDAQRFDATLVVSPGYGQPQGPADPESRNPRRSGLALTRPRLAGTASFRQGKP